MLSIILLSLLSVISATHFTFDPTSRATTPENWLNGQVPCVGDHIRFDNTLPVVAFIDHNMNVESITLPDNGIVVFTDNGVDLGGVANWQCEKEASGPKDVFFTRDETHDTSFFNPENWIADGEFFLHMNQVPSEDDDVTVSSLTSAQLYLDIPVVVNNFQWYKRDRMTTDDFDALMRTMEGQFQLQLPMTYARESDQGGIQRMIYAGAVTVRNRNIRHIREGRVNGNSGNETMHAICEYIKCDYKPPCQYAFVPFGHCCPICGAQIRFGAIELDFELAKTKIKHVLEKMDVFSKVTVTAERTTMDQLSSGYEIVIASRANDTFDDELFTRAASKVIEKLRSSLFSHNQKSILDFEIFVSRTDRTIRTASKVIASVVYFSILIALIAGFAYRNLELRVSSQTPFSSTVRYRRFDDDVVIELDDVAGMNPNYEESRVEDVSEGVPEDVPEDVEVPEDSEGLEDVPEDVLDDVEVPERSEGSEDVPEDVLDDVEVPEGSESSEDVEDTKCVNPNFEALPEDVEAPEDVDVDDDDETCPTPPSADIQLIDF